MCCGKTRKGNIDDSKERGSGKLLQRKTDLSRAFRDFGRQKWGGKKLSRGYMGCLSKYD